MGLNGETVTKPFNGENATYDQIDKRFMFINVPGLDDTYFQTSSLKPIGQSKPIFMQSLHGKGGGNM